MKPTRYLTRIIACILLLSSCNAAQPAPPWEAEQAITKPENSADTSYSAAIGISGTSQNGAKVNPAKTMQAVKRIPYKDLYDMYVKHEKTITCDYKGQKLEVLVEILGKEDAVVSCPVVVGLDIFEYIKPRDNNYPELTKYINALSDQFLIDTHRDKYDTDAEVRKKIDQMTYDNMQLIKKEFGYQYNWQVWRKADAISRQIKELPNDLLASKQYDFQTRVDDKTAWALADAIVKEKAEQDGVENSFLPVMERRLTHWKSRWYESLNIEYCQLYDGIGAIASKSGAITEYATDSPFDQDGAISFDDKGVCYQRFHLYKVVRRTSKGDDGLIAPENALDTAIQWLDQLMGQVYRRGEQRPSHIMYSYFPVNSADGIDYKKGEWLMVPFCYVYFSTEDGELGPMCSINALTGKVY